MRRTLRIRPGERVIIERGLPPWLFWTILATALIYCVMKSAPWMLPVAVTVGIVLSDWRRESKLGALLIVAICTVSACVG